MTVFAIFLMSERKTSGAWYMRVLSLMKFREVPPSTM